MLSDIRRQIANGYCVFDLETTGFSPLKDVIIEIAARKILPDKASEDREWLVKIEPRKLTQNIVGLTGITDDLLDTEGVRIRGAIREFAAFADGLPLVGHNVLRFDRSFLLAGALHDHFNEFINVLGPHRFIDTAALFKGFRMGWTDDDNIPHADWAEKVFDYRMTGLKYNLDLACHDFEVSARDRTEHRALPDVIRTQLLFEKLLNVYEEIGKAQAGMFDLEPTTLRKQEDSDMAVKW